MKSTGPLSGNTVICFESRLADSVANMIGKFGARVISAPSMQEVPLEEHHEAFLFAEKLFSDKIDILVCMTGVGTQMLINVLQTLYKQNEIVNALSGITIVARGPKPVRVLKSYNVPIDVTVPEPNTWKEILEAMDSHPETCRLSGRMVAIQEYGEPNEELLKDLGNRGAVILRIPVYRWMLPDDTRPLREGIQAVLDGMVQVAVFTSKTQIEHVMQIAVQEKVEDSFCKALNKCLVASIGPVCTKGLKDHGIHVDFEPSRPKMGIFIQELNKLTV